MSPRDEELFAFDEPATQESAGDQPSTPETASGPGEGASIDDILSSFRGALGRNVGDTSAETETAPVSEVCPDDSVPAAAATGSSRGWRTAALVLGAFGILNMGVALVALRATREPAGNGFAPVVTRPATERASEPTALVEVNADAASSLAVPADPTSSAHPTLERIAAELKAGETASARRHAYALLAVIDRLPEKTRDGIAARAHFLLAETRHAEAIR